MTAVLPTGLLLAVTGTLGLLVGSFLNVVIHRVPAGLSIVRPASACPQCEHEVRPRDNVPVLSWLLLRGRCRDCRTPIPWRYPAVEAATGLGFVVAAWRVQEPVTLVAVLAVVAAGIALAVIDVEHQRLPFAITGVSAAWVLAVVGAGAVLGAPLPGAGTLLVSVAVWGGVYGGIWLLTAGRGMGLGDVALAPVLGLVLGLVGVGAAVVGLAACFGLGLVVGVGLLAAGHDRRTRVPHGPFMLAGAAVGVLAGTPLAGTYLRLTGLA